MDSADVAGVRSGGAVVAGGEDAGGGGTLDLRGCCSAPRSSVTTPAWPNTGKDLADDASVASSGCSPPPRFSRTAVACTSTTKCVQNAALPEDEKNKVVCMVVPIFSLLRLNPPL